MNTQRTALEMRLEDLESRLTFQEDTLIQLSDTIALQDAKIQTLLKKLERVSQKYQDLNDEMSKDTRYQDEKPPHY
ncbi:MAG: SlyX family protein [Gammaproteobacteria bacterium]|nr:SlyX family protein [Gammaproteobacteria bacterium]